MDYEKFLPDNLAYRKTDKARVLALLDFFREQGYTYEEARRIMELAGSVMQRAAMSRQV